MNSFDEIMFSEMNGNYAFIAIAQRNQKYFRRLRGMLNDCYRLREVTTRGYQSGGDTIVIMPRVSPPMESRTTIFRFSFESLCPIEGIFSELSPASLDEYALHPATSYPQVSI